MLLTRSFVLVSLKSRPVFQEKCTTVILLSFALHHTHTTTGTPTDSPSPGTLRFPLSAQEASEEQMKSLLTQSNKTIATPREVEDLLKVHEANPHNLTKKQRGSVGLITLVHCSFQAHDSTGYTHNNMN